ncbi:MAG: SpoIID/LytB domain-containing protein [Bacteroidales bacterium]|nr:SpoIID/LytB domain-containing protein [Bacteroidales bacterium]
MKKIITFSISICSLLISVQSQTIDIGLFYDSKVTSFTFHVIKGEYQLMNRNKTVGEIKENSIIYITLIGKYIQVRDENKLIGTFRTATFNGIAKENEFIISTVLDGNKSRQYSDGLSLKAKTDYIQIINHIDIEKYIAGVVESESGSTAELEYYKSQALICRTYAYKNMYKHGIEGFNLCDGIHCQAYKGNSYYNELIPKATNATRSLIIVDSTLSPIDAAFHSNSGGLTANSEDVWQSSRYYLRSVPDSFSLKGKNASWIEIISFPEWKKYLKSRGFSDIENRDIYKFHSKNPKRRNYYQIGLDSISYNQIRKDWNLKSSYFSVKSDVNNNIVLEGKGYGHGVGLSQEGGMEMARQGKNFEDIVHFYYTKVRIITARELKRETGKSVK